VLEAAVAVANRRDLEQVAVERRATLRRVAEEVDLPLAHAREIAGEPLEVGLLPAGDGDLVPDAAGGKRREGEVAHLDRVVDEARRSWRPDSGRRRAQERRHFRASSRRANRRKSSPRAVSIRRCTARFPDLPVTRRRSVR
jgi:hypothetical protein